MILKSKKSIFLSVIILIIFYLVIFLNYDFFYYKAKKIYHKLPGDIKSVILLTFNKKSYKNIDNDYNISFLPETQLINFDYTVKDMSFDDGLFDYSRLYTYYIDILKNYIIITTRQGNFYKANIESVFEKKKQNRKNQI
tara:strand:+ start:106 stop:522 length:417 start_codon:yes stop_codon:yes gene_type:complete